MESHPFMAGHADWVATNERLTARDLAALDADAARLAGRTRFHVVLPLALPEALLAGMIDSLLEQIHPTWSLALLGDPKRAGALLERRQRVARVTARKVAIPASAEEPLPELLRRTGPAADDYVLLLDAGQRLSKLALYLFASAIESEPRAVLFYADEDVVDARGERRSPSFKPAWSPDYFVEHDYVSSACVYRAAELLSLGDDTPESSPELTLRLLESLPADRVGHVPHILFHLPSPAPPRRREPAYVERYLRARNESADVLPRATEGSYRVRHSLPDPLPLVSVIISTRDQPRALDRCLETLAERTDYHPYEILVVDNDSKEPETAHLLETLQADGTARVLRIPGAFNFAAIQNRAARYARGEVLCFLNDDTEVVSPSWLGEMVRHALRPCVGAVGAMLYYRDGRIQHAGVVLGTGRAEVAGHAYRGVEPGAAAQLSRLTHVQNYSAVTAACLVMRREVLRSIDGFDERLAVDYNDLDLCLRLRARGLRIVWTPDAELIHAEAITRARDRNQLRRAESHGEIAHVKARWGELLRNDPAYNPNLSLFHEDFRPALRTRAGRPWEPEPDGPPEFSVVLPTHDRLDSLRRVIGALESQCEAPPFELVVIDDGSRDGTAEWLEQHAFQIPAWIHHQANRGPAAARNVGVEAATGRWLALLDDDTVPAPDWLARLRDAHHEQGDLDHVAVLGRTDWHSGRHQTRFARHIGENGLQFGFARIEKPDDLPFTFFYGCNLSIDRLRLLAEPFQTRFPYPAWEDIELGFRHIRAGARLVYAPHARVEHDHPGSMRGFWRRQERAGFAAVIFARLHPEVESMFSLEPDGPPPRESRVRRLGRLTLAHLSEHLPIGGSRLWEDVARDFFVDGLHRGWRSIVGSDPRHYEAKVDDSLLASLAASQGSAPEPSFYVDRVTESDEELTVNGWAFWSAQSEGRIEITVGSEQYFYVLGCRRVERSDVTNAHGLASGRLGFEGRVYKQKLRPGSYRLALVLSRPGSRTVVHDLDKTVNIPSRWPELRSMLAPRPDVPSETAPSAR